MAYLVFSHRVLFFDLFDHDYAEVFVGGVASGTKMLVYFY